MKEEYGKKVHLALKAVAQMHSDTSKLLVDCDKDIGLGRPSVFGSNATRDLTWSVQASFWMAEGVYRYYDVASGLVEGLTVSFLDTQERAEEPLFLVAQIQYNMEKDIPVTSVCDSWDTWSVFFDWAEKRELGALLSCSEVDDGRIQWAKLIAVPLYSIERIEDVKRLMDKIRDATGLGGRPKPGKGGK